MKPTPYIGITDFSTSEQVEKMTKFFKERNQGLQHFLHVGVMSSWKSLNGIPTKFDDVWPKKEHLSHVFMERIARDPVFACLHYADYDIRSRGMTWKTILKGLEASGVWLDGLQLDMVWPDFAEIDTALTMHRYPIKVILQVNSLAFDLMDNDPKKVVEKLDEYRAFLSYVLLDKSMGKGHPLDSEFLLPFIREINQQIPDLGIVWPEDLVRAHCICLSQFCKSFLISVSMHKVVCDTVVIPRLLLIGNLRKYTFRARLIFSENTRSNFILPLIREFLFL